jgi:hypothetical protein
MNFKTKENKRLIGLFSTCFILTMIVLFPILVQAEGANRQNSEGQTTSSGKGLNYIPMEQIPGLVNNGDLPTYIVGLYKFGIWTVGICALLMIVLGGFMYVTSAGNNASMGKAKTVITDAIIGLIMALTAYLLLNEINPDLLKIKFPTGQAVPVNTSNQSGNASNSNNLAGNQTAQPYNGSMGAGKGCDDLNAELAKGNSYNVPPDVLKTLAAAGEGTGKDGIATCNKKTSSDGHGSCGYFQVTAQNRCSVCGICNRCPSDTTEDVNCGAKFVSQEMYGTRKCGTYDLNCIGAYYNDGGNCAKTTVTSANYCDRLNSFYTQNFGSNKSST